MALEFSEYHMPTHSEHRQLPQMCHFKEQANQSLAIGAVSVPSAAFNGATDMIVVTQVSADCRIQIAGAPVAVAAGVGQTRFLKAGNEYAFQVKPGDKLAVINA